MTRSPQKRGRCNSISIDIQRMKRVRSVMHKPILLFAALALAAAPAAAQLAPQYGTTPPSQAAFRAYIQQRDQLEEIHRQLARPQSHILALEAQPNSRSRGSVCC